MSSPSRTRRAIPVALTVILCLTAGSGAFAAASRARHERGTVVSVHGRRLTIRERSGRRDHRRVSVTVPRSALVTLDGHRARLSALRPGDNVVVRTGRDGRTTVAAQTPKPKPKPKPRPKPPAGPAIRVEGNQLVDAQGQAIQLVGINRMTGNCVMTNANAGDIYGPYDQTSISELKAWHVDAVRITGNEDCWLGINGAPPSTSGAAYRQALTGYVDALTAAGIYVILDLHENAPGNQLSYTAQVMADADHAPAYWTSVADTFRHDPAVIFEPYNEPKITTSDASTSDPWACWLNGCEAQVYSPGQHETTSETWSTAGMQELVDAIRATGATNVISLSGLNMANDLSGLLAHLPSDPDHQLAATFHNYGVSASQNEGCGPSCWDSVIAGVAAKLPVLTDEIGQSQCGTSYVSQYMDWADSHGISYLAWGWAPWGCAGHAYGLVSDWSGAPNTYGQVFFDHFATVAGRGYHVTSASP